MLKIKINRTNTLKKGWKDNGNQSLDGVLNTHIQIVPGKTGLK